jgi:hypothetical protein
MAAPDGSYDAGVVTAQGTRDAQVGDVAARIERLPLTSYQRGIFCDPRDRMVLRQRGFRRAHFRSRLDYATVSAIHRGSWIAFEHKLLRDVYWDRSFRSRSLVAKPFWTEWGNN